MKIVLENDEKNIKTKWKKKYYIIVFSLFTSVIICYFVYTTLKNDDMERYDEIIKYECNVQKKIARNNILEMTRIIDNIYDIYFESENNDLKILYDILDKFNDYVLSIHYVTILDHYDENNTYIIKYIDKLDRSIATRLNFDAIIYDVTNLFTRNTSEIYEDEIVFEYGNYSYTNNIRCEIDTHFINNGMTPIFVSCVRVNPSCLNLIYKRCTTLNEIGQLVTVADPCLPEFLWRTRIGTVTGESSLGISVDTFGNVYITGFEFVDLFVAKFDKCGNFLWKTNSNAQFGLLGVGLGFGIDVDVNGNSYVTGNYIENLTLPGLPNLPIVNTVDGFVVKLNSSGMFTERVQFGELDANGGSSIIVGPDGNIFVAGFETASVTDPITEINTVTEQRLIILKYDSNLVELWTTPLRTNGIDLDTNVGTGITVNNEGNIYVVGNFKGTINFPDFGTITSSGDFDIFIAKVKEDGSGFTNVITQGGTLIDAAGGVTHDANGYIYVTGILDESAFLAKYDNECNLVCVKKSSGSTTIQSLGVAVDENNIYITGVFSGTIVFDNLQPLVANGESDAFVAQLDLCCNFLWSEKVGGSLADTGISIDVDGKGNGYITGFYNGVMNFPNLPDLQPIGDTDVYIAKFGCFDGFDKPQPTSIIPCVPKPEWAMRSGGILYDQGSGIAVEDGYAYTTGSIVDIGGGGAFVQKVKQDGSGVEWSLQADGESIGIEIFVENGCAYITGLISGTVTFPNNTSPIILTSNGQTDIFVAKVSQDGSEFEWALSSGDTFDDASVGIAVENGYAYITGSYRGTATFGPDVLVSAPNKDEIFVAKVKQDGTDYEWGISIDNSANVRNLGYSIAVKNGFIYITGLRNVATTDNLYVAKIDQTGTIVWEFDKILSPVSGAANNIYNTHIVVDENGCSYIGGFFEGSFSIGSVDFESFDKSVFVAKIKDDGSEFDWVLQSEGGAGEAGNMGLSIDTEGCVYITGTFEGVILFSNNLLTSEVFPSTDPPTSLPRLYITKVRSDGSTFDWAIIVNNDDNSTFQAEGNRITVDNDGSIYLTGAFQDTLTIGDTVLEPDGTSDIFVAKYSCQ